VVDDTIGTTNGPPIDQYEYEQLLVEMLDILGVLHTVHDIYVSCKNNIVCGLLTAIAWISYCNVILAYEHSIANMMVLVFTKSCDGKDNVDYPFGVSR
jgi:hypothetical protein